ncbi:TonB-dependent siderophore receptor [Cupriavidus sp. DB3]|uniref:TonB-dependent siderophore receptor n=1 Tax=Cupriavidus sp. DB3 TaxID=2873259 RepID=UPI001CF5BB6A|nr:TonB-dependent siderophore receptor [Cupriavidus sp. DB3]MCA7083863.1 TonB-dependent siderophore receptor [Cupriavidus sp. DB3]
MSHIHSEPARPRPRALAVQLTVRLAVGAALASAMALPARGHAQTQTQTPRQTPTPTPTPTPAQAQYDIPAGPLAEALTRYAQQAGVAITVDADKLRGLRTQGLRGRYGVDEGFGILLRGSGYAIGRTPAGYLLVPAATPAPQASAAPADAAMLPAVTVTGSQETALSPGVGFVAKRSAAGTKTDTPLAETPQSISVVTRQQLDDQKPRSVSEALNYTPGAFTALVGATNRYDYVALRGFIDSSVDNSLLDGLKVLGDPGSYSSMQVDPYFLERIDVIRGPASVLYGRASPGGVVALTSKRPQFERAGEAQVTVGNRNRYEAGFDVTGPIDDNGVAAYRITAIGRSMDTQYRHVEEERFAIAPSLLLNISPDTRLLLQAYLQRDPHGGYHGAIPSDATITAAHNGRRILRSFFDGEPGHNEFTRTQRMVGYQFEHAFNDRWQFRQNFRYLSSDVTLQQVYGYGWAGPNTLTRYYSGANESLDAFIVDNQLQGQFDTGPLKHTLLFGVDYQHRHVDGWWESGSAAPIDAFDPVYGNAGLSGLFRANIDRKLEQTGLYLQDQIAWDRWRLVLGGRHDMAKVSNLGFGAASRSEWDGSKFTRRAGLVYLFDNGIAPYASYSEGFNPSGSTARDGSLLPPTESRQVEIGVRYQPPRSSTLLSASLYDLTQDKVAARVLSTPYYQPAGKVRSRGLELEARSRVTDKLSLLASYTYTHMRYVESPEGVVGNTPYQAPQHMASVWADYLVFPGFTVGAGVRYVGTSWADNENSLKVPSYTLVDLMMRLDLSRISPSLKGAGLRVAATNLFDKTYVSSCAGLLNCYYGEARNVMATLTYQW